MIKFHIKFLRTITMTIVYREEKRINIINGCYINLEKHNMNQSYPNHGHDKTYYKGNNPSMDVTNV